MNRFNKIEVVRRHGGQVLWLTLASEPGNVLDGEMMAGLTEVVRSQGRETGVKTLVFQGRGKHFSYGTSIPEHRRESAAEMLRVFHGLLRALIDLGKPTLAVVRGQCLGGGLELAAFCHWIFSGRDARFGQPEIALGVFPPVASLILPWRVGQAVADDLILTGRSLSAREARELGLVHSLSDDPAKAAGSFLEAHVLPSSGVALSLAARASRHVAHQAFLRDVQALEDLYLGELMSSHDANEGIAAFLDKRPPKWRNH